jgi:hypothetical protein
MLIPPLRAPVPQLTTDGDGGIMNRWWSTQLRPQTVTRCSRAHAGPALTPPEPHCHSLRVFRNKGSSRHAGHGPRSAPSDPRRLPDLCAAVMPATDAAAALYVGRRSLAAGLRRTVRSSWGKGNARFPRDMTSCRSNSASISAPAGLAARARAFVRTCCRAQAADPGSGVARFVRLWPGRSMFLLLHTHYWNLCGCWRWFVDLLTMTGMKRWGGDEKKIGGLEQRWLPGGPAGRRGRAIAFTCELMKH